MTEDEEKGAVARLLALRPGKIQNVILEVGERGPTVYLEYDMCNGNFAGHWCDGKSLDDAVKEAERFIDQELPMGGRMEGYVPLLLALALIVLFVAA